jgi:ecotropic viral integration site 5 protein
VFRVFDNCFATGIEVMFRFALTLLIKNEDLLLQLKFDDILSFLKNQILDRYRRVRFTGKLNGSHV